MGTHAGIMPSQVLLGQKMHSPLDTIHSDLQRKVEQEQAQQEERYTTHLRSYRLEPGDPVYARNFSPNSASNL